MHTEHIGYVTAEERDAILRLHERKTALKELFLTLNAPHLSAEDRNALEKGLIEDLAITGSAYDSWWRNMASKYAWATTGHGDWTIDFETSEVRFAPCAEGVPEGTSCGRSRGPHEASAAEDDAGRA